MRHFHKPLVVRLHEHAGELVGQHGVVHPLLHQFLALCAVGAVVAAGNAAVARANACGNGLELASAPADQVGVGAVAVDQTDFFSHQQVVDDDARLQVHVAWQGFALLVALYIGGVKAVGVGALDVAREAGRHLGGNALALLVLFEV